MNKTYKIDFMSFKYKDYDITFNLYGQNEYTVQYCGDDFFFKTEKTQKFLLIVLTNNQKYDIVIT